MAFCSHCGTNIPEGSKFCPSCGASVSNDGVSVNNQQSTGGNAQGSNAGGGYRVYEIPTPALITASKPDYDPRYPSIKSKMAARKAKIATISAADIGLDAAAVAPKVEYLGFSAPPKRAAGVKVQEAEPVDAVNKAMEILIAAKVI